MTFKRSFLLTLAAVFFITIGFASGYLFRDTLKPGDRDWPILTQVHDILSSQGLKEMPPSTVLEYGMIRGLLQAYNDAYTIFVEPPQHELEGNVLQGSFGGIGAQLGRDPQGFWVLYPFPDSPAAQAGVLDGDRLLSVDEVSILNDTPQDTVEAALRGAIGSRVRLTIARRPNYSPQEVRVRRSEIPLPSVTWHLDAGDPRLGVVEVNVIASTTPDEVQKAIEDLQGRGAAAFALDLRDNFGGLLTAGVDTARLFLHEGVVIQQQYRGKELETFKVERPGALADLPLTVIVNQHTASAAEIIAGALKAQGRAKIIGEPTFGKDTIQLVFDLKDGSSLHVTAAHWWVPGLDSPIQGNGIQPDIPLQNDDSGLDPAPQAAVQLLFGSK